LVVLCHKPKQLDTVASELNGHVKAVASVHGATLMEAQVDAAVRHGLPAELAASLVTETMAGTAAAVVLGGAR
jgi:pyrroline-5-carboxylate reductase